LEGVTGASEREIPSRLRRTLTRHKLYSNLVRLSGDRARPFKYGYMADRFLY